MKKMCWLCSTSTPVIVLTMIQGVYWFHNMHDVLHAKAAVVSTSSAFLLYESKSLGPLASSFQRGHADV
jgi:hypothetical protein